MGFLDLIKKKNNAPMVPSVLPDTAKNQIYCGQLPKLQASNLFLMHGETCHYIERAIYEKRSVNKKRLRKNIGYTMPGLFKGTRFHVGGGDSEYIDNIRFSMIKGILYITTRRIIFVSSTEGFNRKVEELVAVIPYANCIELQFDKETLKLFVPDGRLPHLVLQMIGAIRH